MGQACEVSTDESLRSPVDIVDSQDSPLVLPVAPQGALLAVWRRHVGDLDAITRTVLIPGVLRMLLRTPAAIFAELQDSWRKKSRRHKACDCLLVGRWHLAHVALPPTTSDVDEQASDCMQAFRHGAQPPLAADRRSNKGSRPSLLRTRCVRSEVGSQLKVAVPELNTLVVFCLVCRIAAADHVSFFKSTQSLLCCSHGRDGCSRFGCHRLQSMFAAE